MSEIRVLDPVTIDKIAAGEVVERPYSVVKELTENAIDAGADAITIEVTDGGKSFIRITDNGSGIEADMVQKAFLRHSTSKLRQITDLESIHTLGFRGEALSSISAVSRVELMTKTKDQLLGISYKIEGGHEISCQEIGLPNGTTILVKDLFYNTPARMKFMKTAQTEGSYIASLIEELSLSHPEIAFKLIMNGKVRFQTPGNGRLKDVLFQIYGSEILKKTIDIDVSNEKYHMYGFIGKPELSRGNRKFESYFVNGRYVKNRIIERGIEDGYKHYMMQHQFPFVLLMFEMDGSLVDVNVHPAKAEVRFSYEKELYDWLSASIAEALKEPEFIPEIPLAIKEVPREKVSTSSAYREESSQISVRDRNAPQTPDAKKSEPENIAVKVENKKENSLSENVIHNESFTKERIVYTPKTKIPDIFSSNVVVKEAPEPYETKSIEKQKAEKKVEAEKKEKYEQMSLPITQTERKRFRLIGEVFDTYWIIEYDGKMYMVDQHAAHEKINYERLVCKFSQKTFTSQQIHPPIIVALNAEEQALMEEYGDFFEEFGFGISSFGGNDYSISAVPQDLYGMNEKEFFHSLLDEMDDLSSNVQDPDVILHRLATAACKMSVKGKDVISLSEAETLLKELFQCDNPYHCPHGRPTMVAITRSEIERMFKRIVS
jgi:DNA mismatch repair protein MutL